MLLFIQKVAQNDKHFRKSSIMLNRSGTVSAYVVIRVILLVFVDNFGNTDIYMKSIAGNHLSLSNKGLRSETYGCSPTT